LERVDCNKIIHGPACGFTLIDHRPDTISFEKASGKPMAGPSDHRIKRSNKESKQKEIMLGLTGC
jgi:hypothetical protein